MEEDKKSLKILHLALQVGVLMIATIFYFLKKEESSISMMPDLYLIAGFSLAILAIFLSSFIFHKSFGANRVLDSSNIKEGRAAYVTRWAMLEGHALINIIFFYKTGNIVFLFIALFLLTFLMSAKPKFVI